MNANVQGEICLLISRNANIMYIDIKANHRIIAFIAEDCIYDPILGQIIVDSIMSD
jgi:hypothetical protein